MALKENSFDVFARNFGYGYSRKAVISSVILALVIFFYIYSAGSHFGIEVDPLNHRYNYQITFSNYVIDKQSDQAIVAFGTVAWLALSSIGRTRIISSAIYGGITLASMLVYSALFDVVVLFSLPIIVSFFIIHKFLSRKILDASISLSANYAGLIVAVISVFSVIITLTPFFASQSKSGNANDYAFEIYILLSSSAPVLIFFFMISSPFKLFISKFRNGWNGKNTIPFLSINIINPKTKALLLLLIILMSAGMVLIPHQPAINSNNGQVGADTGYYVDRVNSIMKSNSTQDLFQQSFVKELSGDRPITLLFLTGIAEIIPTNLPYLMDHIPIVLAPLLVIAIFFLTKEITSNDTASMFAAFLTAVSFHELIGIYSGIYANWLALIIGYTTIVFLIRFLKEPRKLNLSLFSIFLIILLFSHVYTWTILSLVMGLFLLVLLRLNYYKKKSVFLLLAVLIFSVGIDYLRIIVTGYPGGVEKDLGLASGGGAGQQQLLMIWQNLMETTQNYSGGQFNNFIILTLGIFWVFRSNSREISSILLMVFLSVGILPLLFGNTVIQTRYLYDVPLQIPAAIMLAYMMKKHNGYSIVFPTLIWLFAMSIRSLSNFS